MINHMKHRKPIFMKISADYCWMKTALFHSDSAHPFLSCSDNTFNWPLRAPFIIMSAFGGGGTGGTALPAIFHPIALMTVSIFVRLEDTSGASPTSSF